MTVLRENEMFLTFLLIFSAFLYGHPAAAVFLSLLLLHFHKGNRILYAVLPLILIVSFPRTHTGLPQTEYGRVTETREKYAVIQNRFEKILVYTSEMLEPDMTVRLAEPCYERLTSSSGFFAFDFAAYMKRQGVLYQTDESCLETVSHSGSIRAGIFRRIRDHFSGETAAFLNRILLNISDSEYRDSFLFRHGFPAVGFLLLCESLFSAVLKERTGKYLSFVLALSLGVISGMPFALLQHAVFRFVKLFCRKKREQFCLAVTAVLILCPQEASSASFIIPLLFRLSSLISDFDFWLRTALIMLYQSFLYHQMNPAESFLFPHFMKICGFCWFLALLQILFPAVSFDAFWHSLDRLLFLQSFALNGSCFGIGMIPFLILAAMILKYCRSRIWLAAAALVFQMTGLFHPCAEITFINVGQGDSILIREPFNTMNMLVDTGKPEMKDRLYTMLEAKGIRTLETLLITHDDTDHSGNRADAAADFHARKIIDEHTESFSSGHILFHDLNRIRNEDKNQSSIVLYFRMNGMHVMLTGDADRITEEDIVSRYGKLKCDILKLSHHGSATGSCDIFLDALQPQIGIVSSGAYEIYHHPHPDTVKRLRERHIPFVDTKDEGDITILCLPGFNLLVTSQGKIAIIAG